MTNNDGNHLGSIIDRTECDKHNAVQGVACWAIDPGKSRETFLLAICNRRAIKAGANGKISESSYQSKKFVKKPNPRR